MKLLILPILLSITTTYAHAVKNEYFDTDFSTEFIEIKERVYYTFEMNAVEYKKDVLKLRTTKAFKKTWLQYKPFNDDIDPSSPYANLSGTIESPKQQDDSISLEIDLLDLTEFDPAEYGRRGEKHYWAGDTRFKFTEVTRPAIQIQHALKDAPLKDKYTIPGFPEVYHNEDLLKKHLFLSTAHTLEPYNHKRNGVFSEESYQTNKTASMRDLSFTTEVMTKGFNAYPRKTSRSRENFKYFKHFYLARTGSYLAEALNETNHMARYMYYSYLIYEKLGIFPVTSKSKTWIDHENSGSVYFDRHPYRLIPNDPEKIYDDWGFVECKNIKRKKYQCYFVIEYNTRVYMPASDFSGTNPYPAHVIYHVLYQNRKYENDEKIRHEMRNVDFSKILIK